MNRTATVDDLEIIANMRYEMFSDIGTTDKLIDNFIEETIAFYKEAYKSGDCIHILSEIDGEIVACAGAIIKSDFPTPFFKSGKYGYVMDVFVNKEYRKRGIANNLVDELLLWFKSRDISTVKLDASKFGKPLYEKMGFESSKEMSINLDK